MAETADNWNPNGSVVSATAGSPTLRSAVVTVPPGSRTMPAEWSPTPIVTVVASIEQDVMFSMSSVPLMGYPGQLFQPATPTETVSSVR